MTSQSYPRLRDNIADIFMFDLEKNVYYCTIAWCLP